MIHSAFSFAAFAVALQASNALATGGEPQLSAGQPSGSAGDEAAPAPIDPTRLIKRVVTIGNRTIVVDQLAGS